MTSNNRFEYKVFRKEWDSLLERHKYKQAEKLCHEGLAQSPLDNHRGKLYNHLGYLYENFLDDKTFDDILEHYVLSLQVDETNANSHYNLSNFLLEQGMQHLLRALELNPSHTKATKRFTNLTPIKINQTLDIGHQKYQVTELTDDGVKAVLLQLRNDGSQLYERTNIENDIYIGPSINTTLASSRNQPYNNSAPEALEIDSMNHKNRGASNHSSTYRSYPPNHNHQLRNQYSNINENGDNGCCIRCTRTWYVWLICWIIAFGGIALPIAGYMFVMFQTCDDSKLSVVTSSLSTANELNIGIFIDCSTDSTLFDEQLQIANIYLSTVNTNDIILKYAVYQYCEQLGSDNTSSGSYNNSIMFHTPSTNDYSLNFSNLISSVMSSVPKVLNPAIEGCNSIMVDNSEISSLLCLVMVSGKLIADFDDIADAINTATVDALSYPNTFYSFITWEYSSVALYSILGTFDTISGTNNETVNGWTDVNFGNDENEGKYCSHCVSYANDSMVGDVAIGSMANDTRNAFANGITSSYYSSEEGDCIAEIYYYYAIGGVVPLLAWVFITMIVICCSNCKRNKNRNEVQQSIDNSGGAGQDKQSAYV